MSDFRGPLSFVVKDRSYSINTPTIGQLWDIEERKAVFTNGKYGLVILNRTFWSKYNLDNIDMMAHLSVMCPSLISDFKVDNWKDLDPFDFKELKIAYEEQFTPWFDSILSLLRGTNE